MHRYLFLDFESQKDLRDCVRWRRMAFAGIFLFLFLFWFLKKMLVLRSTDLNQLDLIVVVFV